MKGFIILRLTSTLKNRQARSLLRQEMLRFDTFIPFLVRFSLFCFHSIIQKNMKNYKIKKKAKKRFLTVFDPVGPLKYIGNIFTHGKTSWKKIDFLVTLFIMKNCRNTFTILDGSCVIEAPSVQLGCSEEITPKKVNYCYVNALPLRVSH